MLWRLQEAKASKRAVLRVRCLRSVYFICSKGAIVSSLRTTEKFHFGEISGTFGAIPVETGEQPIKVLIMSNMLGRWAQGVNKGSPVTLNGGGVPV